MCAQVRTSSMLRKRLTCGRQSTHDAYAYIHTHICVPLGAPPAGRARTMHTHLHLHHRCVSHSNGQDLGEVREHWSTQSDELGVNVFAYEYSGYGQAIYIHMYIAHEYSGYGQA